MVVLCMTCNTEIDYTHLVGVASCLCDQESDTRIFVDARSSKDKRLGYGIKADFEDISEWEEFDA